MFPYHFNSYIHSKNLVSIKIMYELFWMFSVLIAIIVKNKRGCRIFRITGNHIFLKIMWFSFCCFANSLQKSKKYDLPIVRNRSSERLFIYSTLTKNILHSLRNNYKFIYWVSGRSHKFNLSVFQLIDSADKLQRSFNSVWDMLYSYETIIRFVLLCLNEKCNNTLIINGGRFFEENAVKKKILIQIIRFIESLLDIIFFQIDLIWNVDLCQYVNIH